MNGDAVNTTHTVDRVVDAVMHSDAGGRLTRRQATDAIHTALRTVLGLYCRCEGPVAVDLGNGHVLHCSLKRLGEAPDTDGGAHAG